MRDDLKAALEKMIFSYKPDHGIEGKLHEDTADGVLKDPEKIDGEDKDGANLVCRKAIESLNENEIDCIRDRRLRAVVYSKLCRHLA